MAEPAGQETKRLSVEERIGVDTYDFGSNDFIKVDTQVCRTCESKPCLFICPAKVYRLDEKGDIAYHPEDCLELGACVIVCKHIGKGAITWSYPEGGKGVEYRQG